MVDESIHNNPWDAIEERFVRLEEKFVDISQSMALLMAVLMKNCRHFGGDWWL
jgi:hypothetical protein